MKSKTQKDLQKDLEVCEKMTGHYLLFQDTCTARLGSVYLTEFFKENKIGDPYISIFRSLQSNGYFKNEGTQKNPMYTNFKPVTFSEILFALRIYKAKYTERNNEKSLRTLNAPVNKQTSIYDKVKTTKKSTEVLQADYKKRSFKIVLFGHTIFEYSK